MQRARATIKQLKHAPLGETAAAARARSCELIAAQQRLKAASRQVVDGGVAKRRVANGDGSPGASVSTEMRQFVRVVAQEFVKLEKRLEKRIAELETKMLTDGGTWKMGTVFKPGAVVTYDGAMFVAKKENSDTKPGQSDCWRLMHKTRGR